MAIDDIRSDFSTSDHEAFRAELEVIIAEVFPILRDRIERAYFSGWQRRRGTADDLAQETVFRFFQHCLKTRKIPDSPLKYVVAIARNLAKKQFAESRTNLTEIAESLTTDLEEPLTASLDEAITLETEVEDVVVDAARVVFDDLPRRQKQAVRLRVEHPEATDKELGTIMNIGEDGFRKNSTRGLERMRRTLSSQGIIGRRTKNVRSSTPREWRTQIAEGEDNNERETE